ncbi:GNAT family N-acetyltransferase [Propioniciclava tarda]|uniref:GNAT family N-acetyltransferase n=1 Tax=Propioniciclava tarda TaxID=433330 RepID=A0A4Q9KJ31_PROTD|nr:GNAT family N-acetyltransferase [Propioniciclava tarda]TBT94304.1 GNAT family N-acetyltransferase [Propioniciclava tarda]SMO73956.1 Protein N-acetyltransferase, RimJ/RimL family [Propioniciclava tarda]
MTSSDAAGSLPGLGPSLGANSTVITGVVELRWPSVAELAFRRELLADPASMSYNAGWNLDHAGYDNDTGCLPFPEDAWPNFLFAWSKTGRREYFLVFADDHPVGHAHYSVVEGAAHIGVNILGRLRGRGYGTSALAALVDLIWSNTDVREIVNEFPATRVDADRVHARLGFERGGDRLKLRRPTL